MCWGARRVGRFCAGDVLKLKLLVLPSSRLGRQDQPSVYAAPTGLPTAGCPPLFYEIASTGEVFQTFGIGNSHKTFLDRNDAFAFPLVEQLVDSLS
jgi:hypothetical protein